MRKQAIFAATAVLATLLGMAGLHTLYWAAGVDLAFNWTLAVVVWAFIYSAQQWPDVLRHNGDNEPQTK